MDNTYEKYITLTKNIKHFRQIKKMTQEQLAEKADLSVSYIKQIESGLYKNVSFNVLVNISEALEINLCDLVQERVLT